MTPRRKFLTTAGSAFFALAQSGKSDVPGLPRPDDPRYWSKVRDQFMLSRDKVYFNNGTIGAMPKVVFEKTVEHLRKMATDIADWDYRGEEWISGYGPAPEIRGKAAKLLNADPKEVGLTENVTAGMSYLAAGIQVEPGSEILISDQEHPGGQSPWLNAAKRHGATLKKVTLPKPANSPGEVLDLVKAAFTPNTKVLAISHLITGSGAIIPAKEICAAARERGIFTILDGAQAFGHINVDVKDLGCDAYAGCFHKWIMSPAGTGFLYVRKDRAKDVWSTLASSQWDNHEDEGYRFSQRGTGSMSLMAGLDAALDFHNSLGPERVRERIKYLGDYLRDGLRKIPKVQMYTPKDPAMAAGITVYGVEGVTGRQLQDEMWNRAKLRPRASGNIGVRHCTHIFNSPAEIDRALGVVRALSKA
jgi:isopenicillin-N epimerase